MTQERLTNLDILRAAAAMSVCLFHFGQGNFLGVEWITSRLTHGYLGVDVFFVVSGFVIPLTLDRTRYRVADAPSFLASRFVRLYPAYLIAALVPVAIWYVAAAMPGFRGLPPSFSRARILGHIFLTCDLQGEVWLIPVFWTLAIEAQYCLVIALSFAGLTCAWVAARYMVLSAWVGAPLLLGKGPTVFTWTALFALGILCFMRQSKRMPLLPLLLFASCAFGVQAVTRGWWAAVVGVATAACILGLPEIRSRVFIWLGGISYSLYLLHVPFGGRVVHEAGRLPETPMVRLVAMAMAILVSLGTAAVLFYTVERPSHELSRIVRRRMRSEHRSEV